MIPRSAARSGQRFESARNTLVRVRLVLARLLVLECPNRCGGGGARARGRGRVAGKTHAVARAGCVLLKGEHSEHASVRLVPRKLPEVTANWIFPRQEQHPFYLFACYRGELFFVPVCLFNHVGLRTMLRAVQPS